MEFKSKNAGIYQISIDTASPEAWQALKKEFDERYDELMLEKGQRM
jgi:hypothetical protein